MRTGTVYIMSNFTHTVFYIGVTNNIMRRVLEHKSGLIDGFVKKYKCTQLLYYLSFPTLGDAIAYEKYLKGKTRRFKEELILKMNPERKDLSLTFHPFFSSSQKDIQNHVKNWIQVSVGSSD